MNTLKEIDGRYYQECNVVMLATNYAKLTLFDYKDLKTLSYALGNHKGSTNLIPQHLYITSNEEIKEGDWYIWLNKLYQTTNTTIEKGLAKNPIIATTDESLVINQGVYNDQNGKILERLPKPSDSFISKYIEEYNKGNIISDVLVEYKLNQYKFMSTLCTTKEKEYELKVDSNNTITIKKVKDSYSREEVIEILGKMRDYCKYGWKGDSLHRVFYDYNNWIKENL